jgi:hypothetical protein
MEAVGYDSYYSTLVAIVVPTAPIVPIRTGLSLCYFSMPLESDEHIECIFSDYIPSRVNISSSSLLVLTV